MRLQNEWTLVNSPPIGSLALQYLAADQRGTAISECPKFSSTAGRRVGYAGHRQTAMDRTAEKWDLSLYRRTRAPGWEWSVNCEGGKLYAFQTEGEAEHFISDLCEFDRAGVGRGDYSLDGPNEEGTEFTGSGYIERVGAQTRAVVTQVNEPAPKRKVESLYEGHTEAELVQMARKHGSYDTIMSDGKHLRTWTGERSKEALVATAKAVVEAHAKWIAESGVPVGCMAAENGEPRCTKDCGLLRCRGDYKPDDTCGVKEVPTVGTGVPGANVRPGPSDGDTNGVSTCGRCQGHGWVFWDELDDYAGPAVETGIDDTRYPCPACGGNAGVQERAKRARGVKGPEHG